MSAGVSIIGLGWLGVPLAQSLQAQGVSVCGSVRGSVGNDDKLQTLAELGIKTHLLTLPVINVQQTPTELFEVNTLIIAITPGFKRGQKDYADNVAYLVEQAEKQHVKTIILLSSTGVYTGLQGEIDEQSELDLTVGKVQLLAQAEQAVLNFSGRSLVLRLAGLVGENRNPGRFLAGKQGLLHGGAKVNLIHQQDVIGIIETLIQQTGTHGVFNCISPLAATRAEFYQLAANQLGLTEPEFASMDTDQNKHINGQKLEECLGYQFTYPDMLRWLQQAS